jgi:polysaccharide biosynthesis protein PelA
MFGKKETRSEKPFFIYYGLGTPEAYDRLRHESLVILELRQWEPSALASLREGKTKIYGYLPVMESPAWNEQRIQRLTDEDYWLQDEQRVRFHNWDSFLMDLRSPSYRRLLLEEWEEMQAGWPLDGIFLDTVGDIEEYISESLQTEVSRAYRAFLSVAATRYPSLQLIQNRGFSQLETCSSLLDAILWEDWRADWTRDDLYASRWINQLRKLQRERNLTVYATSSTASPENQKSANKLGFLHRYMDPGYQLLPDC